MSTKDHVSEAGKTAAAPQKEQTTRKVSLTREVSLGRVAVGVTPFSHSTGSGGSGAEIPEPAQSASEEAEARTMLERVERELPAPEQRINRLMYHYGL
jgi:hypothetical protein